MRMRPSARLLVTDRQGRLLLFRFRHDDGPLTGKTYWATPGGALDEGESFAEAARRELYEETQIRSAEIIAEHTQWLNYDLPVELVGKKWGGKYRDKIDIIRSIKSVTTPTFPHPIRIGRDDATGAMSVHESQPEEYAVLPLE